MLVSRFLRPSSFIFFIWLPNEGTKLGIKRVTRKQPYQFWNNKELSEKAVAEREMFLGSQSRVVV
jgi:hypothetical protein